MKKAIILLCLLAISGRSGATFVSGYELHGWLLEQEKLQASDYKNGSSFDNGLFNGFVIGVYDAGDSVLFCAPNGVKRGQLTAVTAKYLKNNPELWNYSAVSLIQDALKKAFPCKK